MAHCCVANRSSQPRCVASGVESGCTTTVRDKYDLSLAVPHGRTISGVRLAARPLIDRPLSNFARAGAAVALGHDAFGIRDPLGAVRLPPDPLAPLDVSLDGFRPSEGSYRVAASLAVSVDGTAVLEDHIASLAGAPETDLLALRASRGQILFARTFLAAATSDVANRMRGLPLDAAGRNDYVRWDNAMGHVFGLYDPQIHALIFTPQAVPINHERVTLHELGHALTLRSAWNTAHLRADILLDLPDSIALLLNNYAQGTAREAIRERVFEALAEAYAWWVVGRWRELPRPLFLALHSLLTQGELPLSDA